MSFPQDVFIVAAARSAIGSYGGAFRDLPLAQLATVVVKAALERSGVEPARVGHGRATSGQPTLR